jgi:hypothetical protein
MNDVHVAETECLYRPVLKKKKVSKYDQKLVINKIIITKTKTLCYLQRKKEKYNSITVDVTT